MTIEIFGTVIFRAHADYTIFYLSIIAGLLCLVQIYRMVKRTHKFVILHDRAISLALIDYIEITKQVKDP